MTLTLKCCQYQYDDVLLLSFKDQPQHRSEAASYLLIGRSASGHKHDVETSKASNRDEEQACNTHYSQPGSAGVKEYLMTTDVTTR